MDLIHLEFLKSEWIEVLNSNIMEAYSALCNFSLKVSNLSIFISLLFLYAMLCCFAKKAKVNFHKKR